MNLFTNLPPQTASDDAKATHIKAFKRSKQTETAEPKKPASDPAADLALSKKYLASAQKVVESFNSPWRQYRSLQQRDPVAAGRFWRKNHAAIKESA